MAVCGAVKLITPSVTNTLPVDDKQPFDCMNEISGHFNAKRYASLQEWEQHQKHFNLIKRK